MRSLVAITVVISAIGAGALAQAPAGAGPAFEAASIKPVESPGRPIDFRFFPNRFVATTVTLSQLIEQAYGIQPREMIGGPDRVRVDRFDVTATAGKDVDREQMKLMLQSLLADRFQLQIARELQTGTIYRLTARSAALERDLGLKLLADKGPIPVHVIRGVSKPSAN